MILFPREVLRRRGEGTQRQGAAILFIGAKAEMLLPDGGGDEDRADFESCQDASDSAVGRTELERRGDALLRHRSNPLDDSERRSHLRDSLGKRCAVNFAGDEGRCGGTHADIVFKMPNTLWNREYGDKARLLQFRRAVKGGNKPSRWYYDNRADRGSAYRRRYVAVLEIAADIIENSPCEGLVSYAKNFIETLEGNCL
jgi:hypothetical protein